MDDIGFAERLSEWLRDSCGIAEPRRIARREPARIVVSKFDEGFAARLHDALARVPELSDPMAVHHAYAAVLVNGGGGTRASAWHEAVVSLVETLGSQRGLDRDQLAEVRAGVDSVAALLDSILWTSPLAKGDYVPGESEREAYREAVARMDDDRGIFTRYYGVFEGARVENYCPGARLARTLLGEGWTICSGTPPPTE